MLKKALFSFGIFVMVLGGGIGVANASNNSQDYSPCADRLAASSEACYTITSINDFPPSIRMEHTQIPRIALIWVEISTNAGGNLLKNANYTYYFESEGTPGCPNGATEVIGVLGNYGNNGFPQYPSGIGVSKIECN